jgi:cyclase
MKKTFLYIAVLLLVFNLSFPAAQLDVSIVNIESKHIADAVSIIEMTVRVNQRSRPVVLGVSAGPDGILLVDTGYAHLADRIQQVLDELGGRLKYIVNTHWHQDHTGGNPSFGSDALIIAHNYTRKKLLEGDKYSRSRVIPPAPKQALPVIAFDDSISIHFNGEEIKMFHVRYCHTQGDIIVYFTKSKVVHLGQFLDTQQFPSLNVDDGGDVEKYAGEMEKLMSRLPTDVKLISSHGPVESFDYLKNYHRMVIETTDIIRQKIEDGKSLEEIEAEDLPDMYHFCSTEWMTTKDWIRKVYDSLMKKI